MEVEVGEEQMAAKGEEGEQEGRKELELPMTWQVVVLGHQSRSD